MLIRLSSRKFGAVSKLSCALVPLGKQQRAAKTTKDFVRIDLKIFKLIERSHLLLGKWNNLSDLKSLIKSSPLLL